MSEDANRQVVEALWRAFDAFEFDAAGDLLHDDFVCEWPQSRERFRGRDAFIGMNAHYPGQWRVTLLKLIASGDEVVTEVLLRCGDETVQGISFFTLKDGKIVYLREFWPDPSPAPAWRASWAEPM